LPDKKDRQADRDGQEWPPRQRADRDGRQGSDQLRIAPGQFGLGAVRRDRHRDDDRGQHGNGDETERGAHERRKDQPVAEHEDGGADHPRNRGHAEDQNDVVHRDASMVSCEDTDCHTREHRAEQAELVRPGLPEERQRTRGGRRRDIAQRDELRHDDRNEGRDHREVEPERLQSWKGRAEQQAGDGPDLPVQVHGQTRAKEIVRADGAGLPMPVMLPRDREDFVGEQRAKRPAPARGQMRDVRRERRAVQHVTQVDDQRGRPDQRKAGVAGDQAERDELRRAGEYDERHQLPVP
ncbi:hypothetical protein KCU90_g3916, partial [Aureobasidium melanogenum]